MPRLHSALAAVLCALAIFVCTPMHAVAADKVVTLSSLEWPPYTGSALPNQGATAEVAKQAFAAMGYTLNIEFMPWNRAVQTAKQDPAFSGYFPEYPSDEVAKEFTFSKVMGAGPLGIIQQADSPITWETLDDLKQYTVGIVTGYVNPPEIQKLFDSGEIKVEESPDDVTAIRKVAMGRMDVALIDKFVYNYLLATDPSLSELKANVSFNEKIIQDWDLHICFRKDAQGEEMARVFNEGLSKIDWREVQDAQIKDILK